MTAEHIILTERVEKLEALHAALIDLDGVDAGELKGAAIRAGSSSYGSPPIPRPDDPSGTAHHDAHIMLVMAEALVFQQARIEKLEKAAAKKK